MTTLDPTGYRVLCDPALLRTTLEGYRLPEPATELEEHVLTTFSRANGRLVLHERVWGKSGELERGARSLKGLSPLGSSWLTCSLNELNEKKLRKALWWSTIVAPLSFFLEVEPESEIWTWFVETWAEENAARREVLKAHQRASIENLQALLRETFVDYRLRCNSDLHLTGFFDEGYQALVTP